MGTTLASKMSSVTSGTLLISRTADSTVTDTASNISLDALESQQHPGGAPPRRGSAASYLLPKRKSVLVPAVLGSVLGLYLLNSLLANGVLWGNGPNADEASSKPGLVWAAQSMPDAMGKNPADSEGYGLLSAEQVGRFQRDGYLVLRADEWLTKQEQRDVLAWTDEVQNWPEKKYHWMKYYEESSVNGAKILNRVENYIPYHPGLKEMFNGPKAMGILHQLLGGPCVLYKDKINMKLPGGGGFEPHQDVLAGWGAYNVSNFITFSVSVDHAHKKNGALECVAGEHKNGALADDWSPLGQDVIDRMDWQMVETFPGDAVLFDAYVPHRSAPNGDDHSRRNLYLTYNLAAEGDHRKQYYSDKRKNYPPDIEREAGKEYKYRI